MRPAVFGCLIALVVTGCGRGDPPPPDIVRPIAWIELKASELGQMRRLSGILRPVTTANLSFEVGGKVEEVFVGLGDSVARGDRLATLDARSYRLAVEAARGEVARAEAALTETRNEYERFADLLERGLVSRSGFDNAKAAAETARSQLDVARAQLNIAEKDLEDTILKAPYEGRITKRLVEPAQQVAAGERVFEIEGSEGEEVQLLVPETLIWAIEQGQDYPVHFPAAPELDLTARVSEIGVSAEAANAFPVTLTLNEQSPRLRAGMTVEVDVVFVGHGRTGYEGKVVKIPVSAIVAGPDQDAYVFVYDRQTGTVSRRVVQTENLLNNEVLVSAGLEPGEIVATAGAHFLRDGQKVTLLDRDVRRFN